VAESLFEIWGRGMAAGFAITLFFGMLAMLKIGWHLGHRTALRRSPHETLGDSIMTGAVLSLFGLLVAFTFSGAALRFDHRRDLIVQETNAIGTAYLRLDLTPAGDRAALQDLFRRYLDSRLEVYRRFPDLAGAKASRKGAERIKTDLWSGAVSACDRASDGCTIILLPALNVVFDLATTQTMATETHPPDVILATLAMLALSSALLAGNAMGGQPRHFTHLLSFAGLFALAIFVIVDLEYPRLGLIRVDDFDRALIELRQSMD
jgi:hypothetical protein